MAKQEQNSMKEPTEEELAVYNNFVGDIDDNQMDMFANEYYDLVAKEEIDCSFPKFLIDKIVRPVSAGDTLTIQDENSDNHLLFCIKRMEINEVDYLAFCRVDEETETLIHDTTYLFYVSGKDNIGMEEIDLVPAGDKAQEILNIMEEDLNVPEVKESSTKEEE